MALWANSTESFFLFGAKEEDVISDFYGILYLILLIFPDE